MSVQFGRWNFNGVPPESAYLDQVDGVLAEYAADDRGCHKSDGVALIYRAFHTTRESRDEEQPHITQTGIVLTWDGRLDNRIDLIREFRLRPNSTDVAIVASAYEERGVNCFAKFVGDWALAIWNPQDRTLTLAKDPLGVRQLYYVTDTSGLTWCTVLDPLVLFAGKTFSLEREYIAGWFSFFPAVHLTPYVGIHAVPASCFVRWRERSQRTCKYWDFDHEKRIRYANDQEYEEHFRSLFAQAVSRRLRSDQAVLAELSGGLDSSSVVCAADSVIAHRGLPLRLDTISYFAKSEPHWDEWPYFTKVEEKRGRPGCHVEVSTEDSYRFTSGSDSFLATPGSGIWACNGGQQFAACLVAQGNRVVLSGFGGDEVTGGVPTPVPELMDLLAMAQIKKLVLQLRAWALDKKTPWLRLLCETVRGFLPPSVSGLPPEMLPAAWIHDDFQRQYRSALTGYPRGVRCLAGLPSFQENMFTLDVLRRQLAGVPLSFNPPHEPRYPFLDRDFLEFIYAIPREQLVRPGQRCSLMRRAMTGIVPDEILNRKRKGFVTRSARLAIFREWDALNASGPMKSESFAIINGEHLHQAVQRARYGHDVHLAGVLKTLQIEAWLRCVVRLKILTENNPEVVRDIAIRRSFPKFCRRASKFKGAQCPL